MQIPKKIQQIIDNTAYFPDCHNKVFNSPDYHYIFNQTVGTFIRWGENEDEDPLFSHYGPEMLDIEVSTICHGIQGKTCSFCYKENHELGQNMSFEMFQQIFFKMPKNLTQVALGIGDIDANPDLKKIIQFCSENSYNTVIPNITINGARLTNKMASFLAQYCGAVSVSHYDDKICFTAIEKLVKAGLKQVNIHKLVSESTYLSCLDLFQKVKIDPRLINLHAIVLLGIKPKGHGKNFSSLSQEKFTHLIEYALNADIKIGSDSCSGNKVIRALKSLKSIGIDYHNYLHYIETCESSLFSAYINVEGKFFPCSFVEQEYLFPEGLDVVHCNNFEEDIWNHSETKNFRDNLLQTIHKSKEGFTSCPLYTL